jgi:hypothetical protein
MTESKLNPQRLEFLVVDYSDFEELVQEVYGQEYSFIEDVESGDDSSHSFREITGEVKEYAEKSLAKFKEFGQYCFLARTLLQDLCRQGHIEAGNYLIDVS